MQCIFLAAGKGTRLRPLTDNLPKPLIKVAGKNLLEHKFDQLPSEVTEIIIVVGYLAEMIINYFGNQYKGRKIIYVKQTDLLGSGHAVHSCRPFLSARFMVINGDDLYCTEDMVNCLKYEQAMLSREMKGKYFGGRIKLNDLGHLENIIEGNHYSGISLVNAGLYVLTNRLFDYSLVPIKNGQEFGLPQTLVSLAQDYPVKIIKSKFWLQINSQADLQQAHKIFKTGL